MTETHNDITDAGPRAKFWLGRLVVTTNAEAELDHEDLHNSINRHLSGDWGDVCAEDNEANETALQFGGRLFSVYHDREGVKFWIITESDRSVTTVLLPDDY
jgi:hypothetical protein